MLHRETEATGCVFVVHWTQGMVNAKQAFYQPGFIPSPRSLFLYLWMRVARPQLLTPQKLTESQELPYCEGWPSATSGIGSRTFQDPQMSQPLKQKDGVFACNLHTLSIYFKLSLDNLQSLIQMNTLYVLAMLCYLTIVTRKKTCYVQIQLFFCIVSMGYG